MPHFAAATRFVSSAFGGFLRNKKIAPKTSHAKKTRIRVTTPTMSILIRSPEKKYAEKPSKIASSPPFVDPGNSLGTTIRLCAPPKEGYTRAPHTRGKEAPNGLRTAKSNAARTK